MRGGEKYQRRRKRRWRWHVGEGEGVGGDICTTRRASGLKGQWMSLDSLIFMMNKERGVGNMEEKKNEQSSEKILP